MSTENDNNTFAVFATGGTLEGFETDAVAADLAKLINVAPSKAIQILSAPRLLKGGLKPEQAVRMAQRLESLGLAVKVCERNAVATPGRVTASTATASRNGSSQRLASVTKADAPATEDEPAAQAPQLDAADEDSADRPAPFPEDYTEEQVAAAVALAQARERAEAEQHAEAMSEASANRPIHVIRRKLRAALGQNVLQKIPLPMRKVLLYGLALLVMLSWFVLAWKFDIEVSFLALPFGILLGAVAGSRPNPGLASGLLAAVLLCLAIVAAQYMAYRVLLAGAPDAQTWAQQELARDRASHEKAYRRQMLLAQDFSRNVHNNQDLAVFLVDNGLVRVRDPEQVRLEELRDFRAEYQDELEFMVHEQPDVAEWLAWGYLDPTQDVSALTIMRENTSTLDLVLRLVGMLFAFLLGTDILAERTRQRQVNLVPV